MSNVKVMVGQTWCDSIGQVLITKFDGRIVEFKSMPVEVVGEMGLDTFYRKLSFVPATELEWLAVNVEDWKNGAGFICKFGSQVEFRYGDSSSFTAMYNRKEWCDMRIKLGLELDVNMVNISKEYGVSGKPAVDYLADITRIVASTSHLPAIETGKAVIEYLNKG